MPAEEAREDLDFRQVIASIQAKSPEKQDLYAFQVSHHMHHTHMMRRAQAAHSAPAMLTCRFGSGCIVGANLLSPV